MTVRKTRTKTQLAAEAEIETIRAELGPFVTATESARMPMIFLDAGTPEPKIAYANDSFLSLTGYGRDELLGQGLEFVLDDDDDVRLAQQVLRHVPSVAGGGFEVWCKRKSGQIFPASVFSEPVLGKQGETLQYFASFVDLEENLGVLAREKIRTKSLYNNAPGFIAITQGPDHVLTFANSAFRALLGRRRLEGLSVSESVPEIVHQGLLQLRDQVYRTGKPFSAKHFRIELQGEDGKAATHFLDFLYEPIRDEQGTITGLFCQGNDVTREIEASRDLALVQAQLIHLSRVSAMDTLAATLAHELNQPLGTITNYAVGCHRLANDEAVSDQLREGLRGISEAAVRAGHIIRRLREMTTRSKAAQERFDLTEAQHEAVKMVRIAGCEGVTIVEEDDARSYVFADRVQVQQVIVNLVKNACEACTGDGTEQVVTVSTQVTDDVVTLSVADTGSGVAGSATDKLFDWSDSSKPGGTGIGLAISRTIIENQSGKIWLEDTSLDGSRFCFSLPIAPLAA